MTDASNFRSRENLKLPSRVCTDSTPIFHRCVLCLRYYSTGCPDRVRPQSIFVVDTKFLFYVPTKIPRRVRRVEGYTLPLCDRSKVRSKDLVDSCCHSVTPQLSDLTKTKIKKGIIHWNLFGFLRHPGVKRVDFSPRLNRRYDRRGILVYPLIYPVTIPFILHCLFMFSSLSVNDTRVVLHYCIHYSCVVAVNYEWYWILYPTSRKWNSVLSTLKFPISNGRIPVIFHLRGLGLRFLPTRSRDRWCHVTEAPTTTMKEDSLRT